VVKTASNVWEFAYEASRPSADSRVAGLGNGNFTSAPSGVTIDKTPSCSVAGRIPWFGVTGAEAEQTCQAMGGALCSLSQWQTGCTTNPPSGTTCSWAYAPRGSACTSAFNVSKFCNLGPSYDFNPAVNGDQDGLLVSGSASLKTCYDDWSGLLANPVGANRLFDVTGNLRELVKIGANQYAVMGGAFNSAVEAGAACGFTFYQVDQNYSGYDVGFRCCFSADPGL
jgi:hypothetical protein